MPMKVRLSCTRYDLPALIDALRMKVGAEVGVSHGHFSYYLLRHSRLEKLYSVDSYEGRGAPCRADAEHYLSEFGQRSELLVMKSTGAAELLRQRNVQLDFCYIDADHQYQAVLG